MELVREMRQICVVNGLLVTVVVEGVFVAVVLVVVEVSVVLLLVGTQKEAVLRGLFHGSINSIDSCSSIRLRYMVAAISVFHT